MVPVSLSLLINAALVTFLATAAMADCRSGAALDGQIAEGGTSRTFQLKGAEQRYVIAGLYSERPLKLGRETVSLHPLSEPDRYGRVAVTAFGGESLLQSKWLEQGKAIIYGRNVSGACLEEMRRAENVARAENLGWWRENAVFRSYQPQEIAKRKGRFAIVSGRILSVGDRKRRLYLNFGHNWAEDFTVSVAKTGAGRFNGDVDELIAAKGRRVEIRGLVELARGPLIRLFHVSQIRFLD